MPDLSTIKLKLAQGDLAGALFAIEKVAQDSGLLSFSLEVSNLRGRLAVLEKNYQIDNVLSYDEYNRESNRIRLAVSALCADIELEDNPSSTVLQDHHRLTCDRSDQYQTFLQHASNQQDRKAQFYYLIGGNRQSHFGFVQRLAFEMEGRVYDYLNPDFRPNCRVLVKEVNTPFNLDEDTYKVNLLKNLFATFNISFSFFDRLLDKQLNDLLRSPELSGFQSRDLVCTYIRIGPRQWNSTLTPQIARWFIHQFCGGQSDPDSPYFFFFFGVEYEDEDAVTQKEVQQEVLKSKMVMPLPELNMVDREHVESWLDNYRKLEPDPDQRNAIIHHYFGNQAEFYMIKVEKLLGKIILAYNNKTSLDL